MACSVYGRSATFQITRGNSTHLSSKAQFSLLQNLRIAPNPLCDSWHPPVCQNYKTQSGCRFGGKCSFLHREAERQPNRRTKNGGGKASVALVKNVKQLRCVFQDVGHPPVCQNYRSQTGCMLCEKCSFLNKETDRQEIKKKKEEGWRKRVSSPHPECEVIRSCTSGYCAA